MLIYFNEKYRARSRATYVPPRRFLGITLCQGYEAIDWTLEVLTKTKDADGKPVERWQPDPDFDDIGQPLTTSELELDMLRSSGTGINDRDFSRVQTVGLRVPPGRYSEYLAR